MSQHKLYLASQHFKHKISEINFYFVDFNINNINFNDINSKIPCSPVIYIFVTS